MTNDPPTSALAGTVGAYYDPNDDVNVAHVNENTDTRAALHVGDFTYVDQDPGNDQVYLTGPDKDYFELRGSSIYLKAGVVLDYETKNFYSITINIDDPTLGATPDTSAQFFLKVNNVEEPGFVSPTTATLEEDSTYTLTLADFAYRDPEGVQSLDSMLLQHPTHGSLWIDYTGGDHADAFKVTGQWTVTPGDVANGHVFFTPDPDQNGVGYATVAYVGLQTGSSPFDIGTSPTNETTITFDVTPVNDAPTFPHVTGTAIYHEGNTIILNHGIAVADAELDAANGGAGDYSGAFIRVQRSAGAADEDVFGFDTDGASFTVTGNTLMALNGGPFAAFSSFHGVLTITFSNGGAIPTTAQVEDVLDHITYSNPRHDPLQGRVDFTWSLSDGNFGAQGAGGELTATTTSSLDVHPVDDAPVNATPGDQSVLENSPLVFSAASHNAITVSDVDAGAQDLRIVLNVGHGVLTLGSVAGLTRVAGNGTGHIEMIGDLSELNAALDGLVYQGNADYSGGEVLVVDTDDLGHTGSGNTHRDSDTVNITVARVNEAPVAVTPSMHYAALNHIGLDLKNTGLTVSDADASGVETITLSVGAGTINADAGDSGVTIDGGNGTASLTIYGTVGALNAFLGAGGSSTLTYVADSDTPPASATLTLTISDNDPTGALSGSATATIDIVSIDDPAVATNDSVSTSEDTAVTFDPRANDSDPDGPISIGAIDGTAVYVGGSVAVAQGSVTLNADGSLTFTPAANFNGATSFTYQDGGLHYQFFDGDFSSVTAIPTTGGVAGSAADFDVTMLAQSLTGSADSFGVRYTGAITIATAGMYTFFTSSDDGSALYIDGVRVVNNDGGHGVIEQSGSVMLTAGQHAIEIRYFEGGGGQELHVNVAGPDTSNVKTALFDTDVIGPSTATVDVSVSAVNDAPVLANLGASLQTIEQTPVLLDVTVSDLELDAFNSSSGLYTGASLTIARQGGANAQDTFAFDTAGALFTVDGADLKSGGATFATFGISAGELTITFNSDETAATSAPVNGVLRHIAYTNTSDGPPASVALAYSFDDGNTGAQGSGGAATATGIATVNIGAIDDPATLADNSFTATENTPVTFDVLANDSDPDSALAVSAINGTHVAAGGTVTVANGSVTLNANGTLTYTPTAGFHGEASFTYQAWPGLHYQFFDGAFSTVAALPATGGVEGFASDFDVAALGQRLTGSTDSFGVRYTGMIHIASGGNYTFYTSSDDGSALYIDGVRVVNNDFSQGMTERFGAVMLTPGEHALEIRYFEGGGGLGLDVNVSGPDTANGKVSLLESAPLAPASATVNLSVAPLNATPQLVNVDDIVSATEQTPVLLDDNVTASDADLDPLNGGNGLYTGASLTLARQGGASAEDTFGFDTSGALFSVSGNALQAGGASFATFSEAGGVLTITFTSAEAPATTALVNDALRHIVYTNTSDAPPASIVLAYSFDDGSPGNGQGGGNDSSVTQTTQVQITPVNDAPALTIAALAGYTEGDAFVTLDPALTITDPDGGPGYSATVRITSGYVAGDTIVGNGHFDAATQTFTTTGLAPNATLAALQAVLRNLAFSSTSQNPGDQRKLEWTISDGSADNATVTTTTVIDVTAVDNAPSVPGPVTLSATLENTARLITQAELLAGVTDPDGPVTAINLAIATGGGALTDHHDGTWTYTLGTNDDTSVSFIYAVTDGIAGPVPNSATLDITPVNTAPVNILPGTQDIDANTAMAIAGLAITDVDAGSGTMTTTLGVTHGTLTVSSAGGAAVTGSGTGTVTLSGTLAQINTTLSAANNVVYQGTHDFFGNDTLTVATNDNGNTGAGGPLSDTDQITIHLNTHLTGTPGNDSFTALAGNERIDALGGNDIVTFGFKLTDATVTYSGNQVTIDGPGGSHTVLTGFEKYVFADGMVDNNDGDPLVDDLFYYSHNHDVWNAHVDADTHYHQFGWREARDPDAFFSTSTYLSLNPAVKAAGVDPLLQFDQTGWKQGHDPSILFDVNAYLAANPDVKAAGIDPLAHFLANGAGELRQPIAPTTLVASNGFGYVYYLQHNPDVAAAHIDPFQHFETVGWKEGRNPNAWFDTKGYLAHYGDVAAAGVNPLDQYNQSGWKEGRDPSVNFDTADYLGHYPDVANAHINPLTHFLQHGLNEGRSPFGDGVWG